MRNTHPTTAELRAWLETGRGRHIEDHVASCAICQEVLDGLTELDDETVAGLLDAVAPPQDLTERTSAGVDDRLRTEAAASAFVDLFALGLDFVQHVGGANTVDDEPHSGDALTDGEDDE